MKILLPVDGSPASLAAVGFALRLIDDGLRAEFVVVNVQEPASLYEIVFAHDAEVIRNVRSEAGAELLRPAEAMLQAAGLAFESEVAGGQPATVLLDLIDNHHCDVVVMGARGAGSGFGSIAVAMQQRCPVPLTLVRPPEDDDDDDVDNDAPEAIETLADDRR